MKTPESPTEAFEALLAGRAEYHGEVQRTTDWTVSMLQTHWKDIRIKEPPRVLYANVFKNYLSNNNYSSIYLANSVETCQRIAILRITIDGESDRKSVV